MFYFEEMLAFLQLILIIHNLTWSEVVKWKSKPIWRFVRERVMFTSINMSIFSKWTSEQSACIERLRHFRAKVKAASAPSLQQHLCSCSVERIIEVVRPLVLPWSAKSSTFTNIRYDDRVRTVFQYVWKTKEFSRIFSEALPSAL